MNQKKRNILMWALYGLVYLIFILCQDSLLGRLAVAGVNLVLAPIMAACVGVLCGAEAGALFSLAAGFFWALCGADAPGVTILTMTLAGALGGYLCQTVLRRGIAAAALVSLMALFLCQGASMLVMLYFYGGGAGLGLRLLLRQVILSMPLCPAVYYLCRKVRKVAET